MPCDYPHERAPTSLFYVATDRVGGGCEGNKSKIYKKRGGELKERIRGEDR